MESLGVNEISGSTSIENRLNSIILKAPQLAERFCHFAFTTTDYSKIYRNIRDKGELHEGDELDHGQLCRPGEVDFTSSRVERGSQELLTSTLEVIAQEIEETGSGPDSVTNWETLSLRILDNARADGEEISPQLLAAFSCSLLSGIRNARLKFLWSASTSGKGPKLSDCLDKCDITFLINPESNLDRNINRYNRWTDTFQAAPGQILDYLYYTDGRSSWDIGPAKPKATQRELMDAFFSDSVSKELIAKARQSSLADEQYQKPYVDPFKIERFAIQQMFISDLMHSIFGNGNLEESKLAKMLAENRNPHRKSLRELIVISQRIMRHLSQPVTDAYMLTGSEDGEITVRQKAREHFTKVIEAGMSMHAIAKYINYEDHSIASRDNDEPWFFSTSGAAAPGQAEYILSKIIVEARKHMLATGDKPSAEELLELALSKRKHLLRISMMHIDDFRTLASSGNFAPSDFSIQEHTPLILERDSEGKLNLSLPLEEQRLQPGNFKYSSAALGCPAGRLALPNRQLKDRGIHATNNMVDYMLEVIIKEAYNRGLLNIDIYEDYPG